MEYIRTILNGGNTYSVFSSKKASEGRIITSYGICAENSVDAVYIPDITTVCDIAMCMIRVISADMIPPDRVEEAVSTLIS